MDMSNFRPELHVAQQSRRDKLRTQPSSSLQHLDDFPNNLEQSPVHHHLGLSSDLVQARNVRNANLLQDPSLVSSGGINFSANSSVLSDHRDAMQLANQEFSANVHSRRLPADDHTLFVSMSHPLSSSIQGCGNWKSLQDSQVNCDWMVNYNTTSEQAAGRVSNIQNAVFVGEVLSNDVKPNYNGCQDVHHPTFTNPSSEVSSYHQDSRKQYGDTHFASSSNPFNYQNSVQNVATVASLGTHNIGGETSHGSWSGSGDGLVLLPSYENQWNPLRFYGRNAWLNRPVENSHQWNDTELGCIARNSDQESMNGTTQALSLSLSSNPLPKICVNAQFGEGYDSKQLHSRTDVFKETEDSKNMKFTCKTSGKSLVDVVGPSHIHRHTGPLGPFTGYATILNSSRFLKPAQELLDEVCIANSSKLARRCEVFEGISEEVSGSASVDAANAAETEISAKGNNPGVSSPTIYSFNKISGEARVGNSSSVSYRPEYQQKKAKLLYLQDEVCGRHKQYHQHMQMVVSSFESVAGLSAATPYVSLALKTVARNFRCLKNAISDQLDHISRALGEDLLSPTTGASSSKGDMNMSKLKFIEHRFQKHSSGGGNVGFPEPQHVWRPQRGLPERSVNVLRAWLFDHFLHPYPTDTDKHMLATQTGLSRNQVSNWFINARVRLWKPMVEEIHMLETKGSAETNRNSTKSDGKSVSEGTSRLNDDQQVNKLGINSMPDKEQLECLGMGSSTGDGDGLRAERWNQEKRSRLECSVATSMDGSLMGFIPYQRSGLEFGGLGSVSLTLGLRQGVESAQQHQEQLQQQEDRLRQQFGGQMIHDFVG